MAAKRTKMRTIKEILRLHYQANLSQRQISKSLNISLGSVSLYLSRAKEAGFIHWPLPDNIDDAALESALFPKRLAEAHSGYVVPDYVEIHQEPNVNANVVRSCIDTFSLLMANRTSISLTFIPTSQIQ